MRLDNYVTIKNPEISRSRAKSLIESGNVKVNGNIISKPSFSVDENSEFILEVTTDAIPYVSRGGLKLQKALEKFNISPKDLVCADIGSSTGGFTDCLLKHGASKVYAIDSGSDQLAEILKNDSRVVSIERFNARYLTSDTLGELCTLAVADLSFISQTLVLPAIYSILGENGEYVGLIKPQFECGKSALNKNGIVKDKKEHIHAIKRVLDTAESCGFSILSLTTSPIFGGDGNKEFLFHAIKSGKIIESKFNDLTIREIVEDRE